MPDVYIFGAKMLVSWDGQTPPHWWFVASPSGGGSCDAEGKRALEAFSSSPSRNGTGWTRQPLVLGGGNAKWKLQCPESNYPDKTFQIRSCTESPCLFQACAGVSGNILPRSLPPHPVSRVPPSPLCSGRLHGCTGDVAALSCDRDLGHDDRGPQTLLDGDAPACLNRPLDIDPAAGKGGLSFYPV